MMQGGFGEERCRALVTFKTKYQGAGVTRAGEIFIADSSYAQEMKNKGNCEILPKTSAREPSRNQAIPRAPSNKQGGKAPGSAEGPPLPTSPIGSADFVPDGKARRRSSSRQGPPSPPKT